MRLLHLPPVLLTLVALALLLGDLPAGAQNRKDFSTVGGPTHDGVTVAADLPDAQHIKNIGSHVDGYGMCVMSSIEMAALHQGLEELRGLRDWCAKEKGGGWPEKVDDQLRRFFKAKNLAPLPYIQYEGPDPGKVMALLSRTGRLGCTTYGYSPRYGHYIAHMTCNPYFGDRLAACLDNNFPKTYEWMTPGEYVRRVRLQPRGGQGNGWVFGWLAPPPPPPLREAPR